MAVASALTQVEADSLAALLIEQPEPEIYHFLMTFFDTKATEVLAAVYAFSCIIDELFSQ